MQILQIRHRVSLSTDLIVKKTKELRNIEDLKCSLELLKIELKDGTVLFIVHAFNSKIGCSMEYLREDDALELWYSILEYRRHICEWYLPTKKNDKNVKGFSIYSQVTGPWFGCYNQVEDFGLSLKVL